MRLLVLFFFCLSFFPFPISTAAQKPYQETKNSSALDDYLDLAALFKELGEYEKAGCVLANVKAYSSDARIREYLGKLQFLTGHPEEALVIFNRLKEKNWLKFLYLGLIYEDLGRLDEATNNYLKSLELKKNSIAFFRLGKIHRRTKQYKQAVKFFSSLISLDSSIRLAYCYLGECLYESGRYEPAYKFLAKAANFYPENKIINEELLAVKDKLGSDFFAAQRKKIKKKRETVKISSYQPEENIPLVRVGLAADLVKFSFSCGNEFVISDAGGSFRGAPDKLYAITYKDQNLILGDHDDETEYRSFSSPITISSQGQGKEKFPFYVLNVLHGKGDFWQISLDRAYRGSLEAAITGEGKVSLVNVLSIEEYLCGILPAEISASANQEALRAQGVAARTFTFRNFGRHKREGFDFCADVHCQVYHGLLSETKATNRAVRDTKGEIVVYNNEPVETFYHSNCGGCLSADAFGVRSYLTSKLDAEKGALSVSAYRQERWFFEEPEAFCSDDSGEKFRWQRVYDAEDFFLIFGFKLEDLKCILPKDKGDCLRYKEMDVIAVGEEKNLTSGLGIRNYFDKLKSSAFHLETKLSPQGHPQMLFFWGAGFGHGAGLCQEGAVHMADKGYTYREILKHYYSGIDLKKLY